VTQLDLPLAERLELGVEADPQSLARVRRALARWLREVGVDGTDAYELIVACGEACANAVAHAYPVGRAHFEVEAGRDGDVIEILVRDYGTWREPSSPHSRGLRLMEELADSVEIDRGQGGTTVRIRKRVEAGA
jgi:anti-sigma regulatory factor (Ser/Thr protein kinase)